MATSEDTIRFICDQAGFKKGRLTSRKMFGEYALYLDGKVVALVCRDQLFLKPTDQGRRVLGEVVLAPPYPGARDYFLLEPELDDPELLHRALQATGEALPAPRPKAKSRARSMQ